MSDCIEVDGKKYYEESYLKLANNNTRRARNANRDVAERCAEIAASHLEHGPAFHCDTGKLCAEIILSEIREDFGL